MDDSINVEFGWKVKDKISGFTGIVTIIGDHLTGCERIGVTPFRDKQNTASVDHEFFYEDQLEVIEKDTEFAEIDVVTDSAFDLGERVRDSVTGNKGIVSVINYKMFNCPCLGITLTQGDDMDEDPDFVWVDEPRLESVDEGVSDEFSEISESDETKITGSTVDAGSENLHRSGANY